MTNWGFSIEPSHSKKAEGFNHFERMLVWQEL
jgi:hypothetical protein